MTEHVIIGRGVRQEARSRYHAPMPEFSGRHLWIFTGVWQVQNPARANHHFDLENLLTVDGPGCWHCEQVWRPDIGARCPGEPRESSDE